MRSDLAKANSVVQALLKPFGLNSRGCVTYNRHKIILIGHAGTSIRPHFSKWLSMQYPTPADPLDTWSKEVIGAIAGKVGGQAVFPSDLPYYPFQQWAMRAENLKPSPLGLLIHPVYGLWHAYRGAILFPFELEIQPLQRLSHPCETCVEKPCLTACPVNAFSNDGYDVKSCRQHLSDQAGQPCMQGGCLARRACPVGLDYQYGSEQMQFHMRAFAK